MCRLIGYVAPTASTLAEQIGDEQVQQFRDLSALHGDGWGTAWLDDTTVRTYRTTARPDSDDQFETILNAQRSISRLVHLRWATARLAVTPENTHPFLMDGIALAHNGSITPHHDLDSLLHHKTRETLLGHTDSERYLALIHQELAEDPDPVRAVCTAVATLRQHFPHASLNALLLTPSTFIAVHASSRSVPPVEDMLASGLSISDLPPGHHDNYFLMRYRRGTDGSVIFSSTGLEQGGWEPLPPESVTTVDLTSMAVHTRELVAGSAA